MNKLRSIMAYIATKYPHKSELSKARLTKLVYLADWFSALLDDKQMTDIEWMFNHYGPYVDDISTIANLDSEFSITPEKTLYGGDKYVISYSGASVDNELTERERTIIDTIIEKTKVMYFNDFINYVYSTYPVSSNERYSYIDLVSLAREYKAIKTANN
ncbi:Panacea domain-containing protein [Nitrosomonas sp.]|uniref:Panacea domain-containing protein n=1 Tax=Nitrosomonas sp. TaxID=42353 RepID=UPI002732F807|nr:Panacea domain-containing protein [Nitrosomonas sp.]